MTQTKLLKIRGKCFEFNSITHKAEIELNLADLHQQHPELWLGEEEIKKAIEHIVRTTPIAGNFDRTRAIYLNELCVDELAKALTNKIAKEPTRFGDICTKCGYEKSLHNCPECSNLLKPEPKSTEPKCECVEPRPYLLPPYKFNGICSICGKPISEPKSAEECKCPEPKTYDQEKGIKSTTWCLECGKPFVNRNRIQEIDTEFFNDQKIGVQIFMLYGKIKELVGSHNRLVKKGER